MIRPWATTLALLLAFAGAAHAQQQPVRRLTDLQPQPEVQAPKIEQPDFSHITIDPALREIVDQFGSDDFAEREAASERLTKRDFPREQIYAVLTQLELNAEQRHRLMSHIISQLVNAPRGALGISMSWINEAFDQPGYILVERIIPGFDAARVLEFRDRITHVDGERLQSNGDFVRLVQSKKPGDAIEVIVQRPNRQPNGPDFESLEFTITLGSLDELRTMPGNNRVIEAPDDKFTEELRWVLQVFVSARQTINVEGELPELPPEQVVPSPVDDDPAIAALLREIQKMQDEEVDPETMQRRLVNWQRYLTTVVQRAREEGLTVAERNHRIEVANRMAELIGQAFARQ